MTSRFSLDISLSDLQTFLEVAQQGSLTVAAHSLGVTTSQVSKSVMRLEAQLGYPLLRRAGRRVALSEQGTRAVPHLEHVLLDLQKARGQEWEAPDRVSIAAPGPFVKRDEPVSAPVFGELRVDGVASQQIGCLPGRWAPGNLT